MNFNQLWIGYSAVQFSLYNHIREYNLATFTSSASVAAFWAGAAGGTCATLATYPFDLCRTTFAARGLSSPSSNQEMATTSTTQTLKVLSSRNARQRQPVPFSSLMEPSYHRTMEQTATLASSSVTNNAPPRTITEFAVQLYQQKGIRGFYYGSNPAVLQIIPYMGLNFMIYDTLVAGDKGVQNSGSAGALSGATSKILVYPIDTIKRRLQAQAFYGLPIATNVSSWSSATSSNKKYTGMVNCAFRIVQEEGVGSFYRGLVPSVLKTTIASSLSFALL